MSIFGDLFGGGQEQAYKDEEKALSQVPAIYHQYMDPYINAGLGAINPYTDALHNLLSNPDQFIGGLQSQAEASYKPSQAYQNQVNAATAAANQAAAAGGMLGTPSEQEHIANTIGNLAMNDQQSYVNNRLRNDLGAFQQGLSGYGGLVSMGNTDSSQMADNLANVKGQMGKAKAGEDMAHASMLGNILGTVGSFIPGLGGMAKGIGGVVGHLFGGSSGGEFGDQAGMQSAIGNAMNIPWNGGQPMQNPTASYGWYNPQSNYLEGQINQSLMPTY